MYFSTLTGVFRNSLVFCNTVALLQYIFDFEENKLKIS